MQNNEDRRNESPNDSAGAGDDEKKNHRGSWNGWEVGVTITLPTKTHDGGGMNVPPGGHREGEPNCGGSRSDETTTTTSSTDSFQTYSDIDTRMSTLLGLEPAANPNDGEEQEDWRQLTGFQGLRGQPRRRDDDGRGEVVEAQAVAAAAAPNGNGETTTTPRNTRISWELHNHAFEHMWMQRGELNFPQAEPPRPRAEQENQDEQDDEERRQGEQG